MHPIVEIGLVFLHTASLPLPFWLYAFQTAIFLINRLPTSVLDDQSPFHILFDKQLDYHSLKAFGCLCFHYLCPYNKHKLCPRSSSNIFVWLYSQIHKCYLCYNPTNKRVYISHHVVFNEECFLLYLSLPPPAPSFIVSFTLHVVLRLPYPLFHYRMPCRLLLLLLNTLLLHLPCLVILSYPYCNPLP